LPIRIENHVTISSGHKLIWWGDATSICNETNASQDHIG